MGSIGRLFGTDGVRGIANGDLTPELVFRLGRAGASLLSEGRRRARILIGRDTRLSGPVLEAALAAGIASAGADAVAVGVIPTPAVAALVRRRGVAGGVMISASHNPAEYNGIKFFGSDGYKFPDEVEDRVEAMLGEAGEGPRPTGGDLGRIEADPDGAEEYLRSVTEAVSGGLHGLRIVLDCAHGAACRVAPELFRRLGARVTVIHDAPDGLNINRGCGSTHPEALQEAVVREGAHAGLAFDGDADRVIAVDERGGVVDGDRMLAVAGLHLKRRGRLPHDTVVATVMSNLGLERALEAEGIRLHRTRVGDRYVLEAMREGGYVLGGEQSGHVIFLEHATTGDGILTGAQLLSILRASGRPLSELAGVVRRYPQVLVNVEVAGNGRLADRLAGNAAVREAIAAAEGALEGRGRVLVRPSGTEPLVRVMVEGEDEPRVRAAAEDLAAAIRRALG